MGTENKRMQERTNGMETVSVNELCEIRWQAAIMYAQKSYRARNERNHSLAEHHKALALTEASKIWQYMGFTECEIIEHKVIFANTILSKGGTYSSVSDYFIVLMKENKMYPRIDQQTENKPI